ncbi:hypothetical protein M1843_06115 [Isoptericola sp. 4D.3]|uniref:Uncharacterized protein n=1 Tax=Isoptericola peretonis TaxID=2918523 RepID=A0ABT0J1E2_9MICO|nr:hypothetical protein [Isoptericola sp. 4D.3]
MHVLICVGEDGAALAPVLAEAWREAAPRCDVETVVLPGPAPATDAASAGVPGLASPGVFVPLDALGLSTVAGAQGRAESALAGPAGRADLVVVHVPALDGTSLREGPVQAAVATAGPRAVPVVVLAGRSEVSRREWSGAGVSGVHETGTDVPASTARVARTWAPSWA